MAVGASAEEASALLGEALSGPDWRSLANLDAAIRAASAAGHGRDGLALARALYEKEKQEPCAIPESYFSARQGEGAMLEVRGAALVRPSEEPVEVSSSSQVEVDAEILVGLQEPAGEREVRPGPTRDDSQSLLVEAGLVRLAEHLQDAVNAVRHQGTKGLRLREIRNE